MLLRVVPGEGGENEIGVEFTDTRPGAEAVTPQVFALYGARQLFPNGGSVGIGDHHPASRV